MAFALYGIASHAALSDNAQPGAAKVQPQPADGDAPCSNATARAGSQIGEVDVIYWGSCPECISSNLGTAGK